MFNILYIFQKSKNENISMLTDSNLKSSVLSSHTNTEAHTHTIHTTFLLFLFNIFDFFQSETKKNSEFRKACCNSLLRFIFKTLSCLFEPKSKLCVHFFNNTIKKSNWRKYRKYIVKEESQTVIEKLFQLIFFKVYISLKRNAFQCWSQLKQCVSIA